MFRKCRELLHENARKYRRVLTFLLGILLGLGIASHQRKLILIPARNENQMKTFSNTDTMYTAVIVLGEKLVNGTQPTANLLRRLRTATEVVRRHQQIYKSTPVDPHDSNTMIHVIFSGGDTALVNKAEANVMKEIWEEFYDVDEDKNLVGIVLETQSLSTCQNAFYSIPILQQIVQQHLKQQMHLVVVTSDYHVARTRLLFEQVFLTELQHQSKQGTILQVNEVISAPTNDQQLRTQLFMNERYWLKPESLEKLLYQMDDHPFYLPTNERIKQAQYELDQMEK